MIQVGGHAATLLDFEIPARHGLRQTIADTLGIGGIFRALRTIPVMLGIGRDMAELCPDAWLLNYTNPMAMLVQAYGHGSPHTKVVGLCHSIQHTTRQLAEYVGVPFEEVTFLGAGVNHQSFILRFERDGEDLYPALDAAIAADPELQRKVRVELYRRFGYFPTESSEHSAEYLPWLMRDDVAIERFRIPVDEYVRRSEENLELYEEIKAKLRSGEGFEIEQSVEYAPLIVHAMTTGQPQVIYGNVINEGLIDNLPAGACVEVPCVVDRTGVQPTRIGALPRAVRGLEPHVLERRRADGARGARGQARARLPRGDARPERLRLARPRHDPDDLRRADRGARGRAAAADVSGLDLLVVGDVNADLVLRGGDLVPSFGQREQLVDHAELVLGGSGAIVAAGAARLGLRVAMAGCVGDDALGRAMLAALDGVDVTAVRVGAEPTGVSVGLARPGDRAVLTALGALAEFRAEHVPDALLASARWVHVASPFLQPGLDVAAIAARAAGTTSLDPGWDPHERWELAWEGFDVLLPNAQEAQRLAGEEDVEAAARSLASKGPTVVVKLGADGALAVFGGAGAGGAPPAGGGHAEAEGPLRPPAAVRGPGGGGGRR